MINMIIQINLENDIKVIIGYRIKMIIQDDDDLSEIDRCGILVMLGVYMMMLYLMKCLYDNSRKIEYEYASEKKNVYI